MRRAALAAIERKLFIHDPNRQRLANRKLMGATNRLPEHPQVTPGHAATECSTRCGPTVLHQLIENRDASILLKKRASGFFKFPKNDLNDLNGWNVWNGHRF